LADPPTDGRHVHEQLGGFAMCALSPAEDEQVSAHMAQCDECAADYLELTEVLSALTLVTEADVTDPPAPDEAGT
jgi:anti-sigma factor RsiW